MTGKRIDLCYEGRETADGRVLEPGALRWPDEPVPVTIYAAGEDYGSTLIGRASAFQRSPEGVISGYVDVTVMDSSVLDRHSVQIAVKDMKSTVFGSLLSISEATLMNVHLMPGFTNAWPDLDRRLAPTTASDVLVRIEALLSEPTTVPDEFMAAVADMLDQYRRENP